MERCEGASRGRRHGPGRSGTSRGAARQPTSERGESKLELFCLPSQPPNEPPPGVTPPLLPHVSPLPTCSPSSAVTPVRGPCRLRSGQWRVSHRLPWGPQWPSHELHADGDSDPEDQGRQPHRGDGRRRDGGYPSRFQIYVPSADIVVDPNHLAEDQGQIYSPISRPAD